MAVGPWLCRSFFYSGYVLVWFGAPAQRVMVEFGMDAKIGFRPDRGTIDGLFTTSVGLHKRKEHGLETWALFIYLAKAFDTVPREALFAIPSST